MVLNNKDLLDRLFRPKNETQRLSIVPSPNEKKFRTAGGASIDLHLGRWFRTMRRANIPYLKLTTDDKAYDATKEEFVPFKTEFYLHPGTFVLGITLEWIVLPGDLVATVTGKSSLGRRGLIIETSSGIHPGFAGCLTLELANVGDIPLALSPGMEICQIFLHRATSVRSNAVSQFKGRRKPGLGSVQR